MAVLGPVIPVAAVPSTKLLFRPASWMPMITRGAHGPHGDKQYLVWSADFGSNPGSPGQSLHQGLEQRPAHVKRIFQRVLVSIQVDLTLETLIFAQIRVECRAHRVQNVAYVIHDGLQRGVDEVILYAPVLLVDEDRQEIVIAASIHGRLGFVLCLVVVSAITIFDPRSIH